LLYDYYTNKHVIVSEASAFWDICTPKWRLFGRKWYTL